MINQDKWEKVERFDPCMDHNENVNIEKDAAGVYVRYADYAALLASHRELVRALEQALERLDDVEEAKITGGHLPICVAAINYARRALANAKGSE